MAVYKILARKMNFCLTVLVLLIVLQTATSLDCYDCSSKRNPACGDDFDETKLGISTCAPKEFCFKIVTVVEDVGHFIDRGCNTEQYCDNQQDSDACAVCQTDFCNDSNRVFPSFTILSIACIIFSKYFLL